MHDYFLTDEILKKLGDEIMEDTLKNKRVKIRNDFVTYYMLNADKNHKDLIKKYIKSMDLNEY